MKNNETTTFRALLSSDVFLDTFRLDRYGEGMDGIDNGDSIPYRMVDPTSFADADAVGHRSLCGSDYSGGALVRANLKDFRAIVAEHEEDSDPLPIVDTYGGYGTDGVLLLLDRPGDADALMALVSVLQGLEDYPLISDETMSELEREDEEEGWTNYAASDFRRAIVSELELGDEDTVADGEALEERLDDVDDGTLFELFVLAAEHENLNGGPGTIHEESGVHFMIDEAAAGVDLDSLREFLRRVDADETIRN